MACPLCARETDARYRPFCSRRCADLDLARWLTGAYAIPTEEAPDGHDAAPRPGDADAAPDGWRQ